MTPGRRRTLAWGPTAIALVAGLSAWFAAMADRDALATPLLSVFVLVAVLATALSWLKSGSWIGFLVATAIKTGVFFALAPAGLSTLARGYAEVRGHYAVWQDYLAYFWALPPALLIVTLGEGWLISLRLAERRLVDTWPARHWRIVVPVVAAVALTGAGWLALRTQYYIWRLRSGYPTAQYRLVKVGPHALPAIEREIASLGRQHAGSYRSELADALVDIRHDVVARRIGSGKLTRVEVALVDVDPALLRALRTALLDEPDSTELGHIALSAQRLDFNTWMTLWRATAPLLPIEGQAEMIHALSSRVWLATRSDAGPTNPWQGMAAAEVRAHRREMRARLARLTPGLVDLLEQHASGFRNDSLPLWGSQALDAVEALGPLSHAEQERLAAVLPKLQSSYFVRSMLEHLGARLTGGDHRAFLELLVDAYRKIPDRDARTALAFWVRSDGFRQGVSAVEFFCAAFDSADSRDRLTLQSVLMDRDRGAKCVVERLGEK